MRGRNHERKGNEMMIELDPALAEIVGWGMILLGSVLWGCLVLSNGNDELNKLDPPRCKACGLPGNKKAECDRWDCPNLGVEK